MKLSLGRKILLLGLAICVALSVLSAETLIANNLGHDCSEQSCRPCLRIEIIRSFLKTFKLAGLILFIIAFLEFSARIPKNDEGPNTYPLSPLMLKVRLNS